MSLTGKPVNKTILKRFKDQRHRGSDGFGYYIPSTNRLTHNAREGRIISLLKRDAAEEILFHHRFPTSTDNVRSSCHPFSSKENFDNQYVTVHNGVLDNEHALKKMHNKEGIFYVSEQEDGSFNDSEALAYDLANYFEGKVDELTASGAIAFITIKRDASGKATKLMFGRNSGNPLVMKRTKHSLTVSSEGDGELIKTNTLFIFDYDTKELTERPMNIPSGWFEKRNLNYKSPHAIPRTTNPGGYPFEGESYGIGNYINNMSTEEVLDEEFEILSTWEAAVSFAKADIMAKASDDHAVAIALGVEKLESMKQRRAFLSEITESMDNDEQLDRYITEIVDVDDDIQYYEEAVRQLELEARGTNPIGFQIPEYATH